MNNIINIKTNNGINVKINKGNMIVSQYELTEQIQELLKYKKKYRKNETILLSNYCNSMYDLKFCGSNKKNKEILFQIC